MMFAIKSTYRKTFLKNENINANEEERNLCV